MSAPGTSRRCREFTRASAVEGKPAVPSSGWRLRMIPELTCECGGLEARARGPDRLYSRKGEGTGAEFHRVYANSSNGGLP
jgi:hypothetical protein